MHLEGERMKFHILKIIIIFTIFLAFSYSQEVGVYGIKSWSAHYEIQNPVGCGVFISKSFNDESIRINFDFNYLYNQRHFQGRIISGFISPQSYSQIENLESNSFIYSIEFSGQLKVLKWKTHYLYFGAGIVIAEFDGHRIGQTSGLRKELWDITKYGTSLNLVYEKKNLFDSHFNFITNFKYKYLYSDIFATDIENVFTADISIIQIQVGISYSIQ